MQIPLLNGIYTDLAADFRSSYPRNMVPVPKDTGIAKGYLRSAGGVAPYSVFVRFPPTISSITGPDRGAIAWNGVQYRVLGTLFCRVNDDNTLDVIAEIAGSSGQVTLDYSFDRLGIASGGNLYYWDGTTLTQVVDPDLGTVIDMVWLGGYFVFTDGTSIGVTDLTDPASVNPLKYGSSEFDPDPVKSVMKLRNELYALNRFTVQVFENVGGTGFPFELIPGALITRGIIGTHAVDVLAGALAFVGSGRNEQPSVWYAGNGETQKIATREIEVLLSSFTEEQLADVVCETREHDGHAHFYIHLPTITAVYDLAASQATGEPVWFYLSSSVTADGAYNFRNFVFAYDRWFCGSTSATFQLGVVDESRTAQPGVPTVGWQFDTQLLYNEGRGFILHDLELVTLGGRPSAVPAENFTDWQVAVQYTLDGLTWSQKRFVSIGKAGEYLKRVQWRRLAAARGRNWIGFRFSGQQQVPIGFARLEARIEALNG